MRKIFFSLCLATLLCSCGGKDYEYALQLFDLYDSVIEQYKEAESMEQLDTIRKSVFEYYQRIEKEQEASHQEFVKDIEQYDENAYLLHLDLLRAESHAQWLYNKRKHELEQQKNK